MENPAREEEQKQRVGTETASPRKIFLRAGPWHQGSEGVSRFG